MQVTALRDGTVLASGGALHPFSASSTWMGDGTLATAELLLTPAYSVEETAHPREP